VDLWGDWDDVLASIANFLHGHGWQYGAPVLAEAQLPPPLTLMPPDKLSLTDTVESLRSRGLTVQTTLPPDTPAILLGAPAENAMGYRVGFENFYVITRYNPRVLYAMAVYDLATAIKADVLQDRAS
jgi:membrane-bound lytic murein transglycosylase B